VENRAKEAARSPGGRASRRVPYVELLALYVLAGGAVSLLGWVFDVRRLADWDDDGIATQPNTCVAVTVTGAALLFLRFGRPRVASALGCFVALIGATVLFQYLSGLSLGIDTPLMFGRTWGRVGVSSPGRMGPAGATCFTLLGLSVVGASYGARRLRRAAAVLAVVAACISGLGLVGYLYGSSTLYSLPLLTAIALQTASFVFAAALALVLAMPDAGPMRVLSSPTAGGVLARRLLPALVLFPLATGFLLVHADPLGGSGPAFSSAMRTLVEIVAFVVLVWFAAAAVDRAAEETAALGRQRLERELDDTRMLQGISTELVSAEGSPLFFDKILDAAARLMRSDFASLQTLHRRDGADELVLLAHRNFTREGAAFWDRVRLGQDCACGTALREGRRVVVADVEACDFMAGTEDLEASRKMGVAAVQSTPLVSRNGTALGMISTHWRQRHVPADRELRLFDILARQAADWIERRQIERQKEALLATESAARAAAERDARLKDEFLATLSHELRTPLTAIMGWAHILKRNPSNPERIIAAAETIERNGNAQAKLITDLLDISRIVAGTMRLDVQRVDLVAIVDAAVEAILPAATAKELQVQKTIDAPTQSVHGDPARLQQVLWNLLSNAVRFTPRGGRIEVTLARAEHTVELRVKDSGVGIAPEFLPQVFDRFRQGDSSTSRQHGGLGLGLAIVKQFTELHGGSVHAWSEGAGHGSTFVIELPLSTPSGVAPPSKAPESGPPLRDSVSPSPPALDGIRVLVVDDEADTLHFVRALLLERGARVETASSASDALALFGDDRFDVVVSDIGMPGSDGYQLVAELRARGIQTPAIALTAFARGDDRSRALRCGFQEHVTKPVDQAELLDAVARLTLGAAPSDAGEPALRTA
jgi:signal transduction histidine kinase/ActR/RegA family two-component response regulator